MGGGLAHKDGQIKTRDSRTHPPSTGSRSVQRVVEHNLQRATVAIAGQSVPPPHGREPLVLYGCIKLGKPNSVLLVGVLYFGINKHAGYAGGQDPQWVPVWTPK